MGLLSLLLESSTWVWLGVLVFLVVGGFWFVDRLLRKGVYDEDTSGSSGLGNAVSNLQTLFDPSHRHSWKIENANGPSMMIRESRRNLASRSHDLNQMSRLIYSHA